MGWRRIGELARTWMDGERTELLTTDHARREQAAATRIRAEREIRQAVSDEAGYALLESVLPPEWASRVTAARPENVTARREAGRQQRLAAQAAADVRLTASGALSGTVNVLAPALVDRSGRDELVVDVELPAPVPMGSDTFAQLTVTVPHYRGPGRYNLGALWSQAESDEIDEWDLLGILLRVRQESTDLDPCWTPGGGPGLIDVTETSLALDLGMTSAVGSSRLTGSIDWSPRG